MGRGRLWRQSPWSSGSNFAKPWLCDTVGKEADLWNNTSYPPLNADWRPPQPIETGGGEEEEEPE